MNAQNDKVVVQSPEWDGLDIPDYLRREQLASASTKPAIKEVLIPKTDEKTESKD